MPGKYFKDLEKKLTKLGYTFSHMSNQESMWVYTHPAAADLTINPSCSEYAARQTLRAVEKSLGTWKRDPKRNAVAVKQRQAEDREKLKAEEARLQAERDEILRQKDSFFSGMGAVLSPAEIAALESRIVQIERRRAEIVSLMKAPISADNYGTGKPRHRSGTR